MQPIKPDYINLGLSTPMAPQLRALVQQHLLTDLAAYVVLNQKLKFDWSNSCIEGHDSFYLDGSLENYSGIMLFDEQGNLVVDGWMEFIHVRDFFLVYWEYITVWQNGEAVFDKPDPGIPDHVWAQFPESVKSICEQKSQKYMR